MKFILPPDKDFVWQKILQRCGQENVYLVGGFVRDTLLGYKTMDMDFCCALPPEEIHSLFPDSLYFPRFGTVTFKMASMEVTIAALRKEGDYADYRHPGQVTFVKTVEEDYPRRDFTVNCLYVDSQLNLLDPTGRGYFDLQSKTLHMIGNPQQRLKEDPLRILRAYRFSYELGFTFDEELKTALVQSLPLLKQLKPQKIKEELRKLPLEQAKKISSELQLDSLDIV